MSLSTGDPDSSPSDGLSAPGASEHKHLQAVGDGDSRRERLPGEGTRDRRSGIFWALGLALLACCGMLLWQLQQGRALEAQVEALGTELAEISQALGAARATITRYELRMDEVRGSVGELLTRVGALQELVDGDPTAQAPGAP